MAKNQYEGYQYIDLDNLYTYKNSTVLINKQNILDPKRVADNDIIYNTYMDGTVYGDLQKLENLFELILEKI